MTSGRTPPDDAPFDYAAVTPDAIRAGCEDATRRAEALIDEVTALADGRRTVENTLLPLDEVADLLTQADGRYGFLAQVAPDPGVREAALAEHERLERYREWLGFREPLFRALSAFAESGPGQSLEGESARLLERSLRDFHRNGMELAPERRAQVQAWKERLVALGVQFRRNIDEYQDALLLTRAQLAGLPDAYIDALTVVETPDGPRYRVSLDYPELFPFLESAARGDLRRQIFLKNHNKAADQNLPILAEAIARRDQIATALGYPSWAHYVLKIRMARSPEAVLEFLADLEARVRVKAEQDMAILRDAGRAQVGPAGEVAIWDWRFFTQDVLRERYRVDLFAVAEYFPLDAVLEGLFALYQALVGVRFTALPDANAWHPDVQLFAIHDGDDGRVIGRFYLDLYPRPDKFGHAAAFTLRAGRRLPDGSYQAPVSALVANVTKPAAASPSLLRHSEVITLFHEFGHILHQTLTRARYHRFAGSQVERDFVEAPSQMLEHWCWAPAALRRLSRHYRTGDPLPDDLIDRMVAARNVSSGIATLRQIYFARLDLAYHGPGARKDTDAIAEELHGVTGFPFPPDTHFQAGFGHLFGYDAGYYGYLWARVFGDDMFTRFEDAGLDDPALGREYRRLILERGGSLDGGRLVRDFLGRDPTPDAFLRHLGLAGTTGPGG